MIEAIVRRSLNSGRVFLCVMAAMTAGTTVAAAADDYRVELCDSPIMLVIDGLPAEPPTVSEVEVCSTLSDHSLYDGSSPFVGELADWQALNARVAKLTVTRDPSGIGVRIELTDTDGTPLIYEARELATHDAAAAVQHHPLERQQHVGGPELSVSIDQLDGGPFLAVDVKDAAPARIAHDAAQAASIDLLHGERLDDSRKLTMRFSIVPVEVLFGLIASDSDVSVTTDRNGALVIGAVKDFKQISELQLAAYRMQGSGDESALVATLEQIVELAKPNDADDVALDVSDTLLQLQLLAINDRNYAKAEKWQRLLLEELKREGRSDSREFALALMELGRLQWRQDNSEAADSQLTRGLALFDRHEPAPLEEDEWEVVGSYLDALSILAVIRTSQGNVGEAIGLWQRVVEHQTQWLGSGHSMVWNSLRSLSVLQRCDANDSDAIATLERIKATEDSLSPLPARDIGDFLMSALDQRLTLLPQLMAADRVLAASNTPNRLRLVEIKECIAEYLTLDSLKYAALQYHLALKTRIELQGRDNPQTQRAARRTVELLDQLGEGGAEKIRRQMQSL